MKKLYYVRHGLTHHNVNEVFSGQVEAELTDVGIEQATNRGKDMKKKGIKIDLIVSSPLGRTMHTAELIAREIGYPKDKIVTTPLIMERSFGVLEETSGPEFNAKHDYKDLDKIEGVESIEALHQRAHEALKYLEGLKEDNVLVVSHGTFGRALRRAIKDEPHTAEYEDGHRDKYRLDNAELVELI